MSVLRQELKSFSHACEVLLSDYSKRPLDEEERQLIVYYVHELNEKLNHQPSNSARTNAPTLAKKCGETRMRMHTKQLQLEHGVLNAVIIGEFELSAAQSQFVELLDEAVGRGATKLLIDGREITGKLRAFERFLYGEFAAWATLDVMKQHQMRLRFAYLIHEPVRDPERFGETVAANRGMIVKTFEDKVEAVQWLHGAG